MALTNADVQVRRGFDLLHRETGLDWAPLEMQAAIIGKGISAWEEMLRYVHYQEPTPAERRFWTGVFGPSWEENRRKSWEKEQRTRDG